MVSPELKNSVKNVPSIVLKYYCVVHKWAYGMKSVGLNKLVGEVLYYDDIPTI